MTKPGRFLLRVELFWARLTCCGCTSELCLAMSLISDLGIREFATFVPLLILAVWIGLYPKPFLDRLETSVDRVMLRVNPDYTPRYVRETTPLLENADADGVIELPVRAGAR